MHGYHLILFFISLITFRKKQQFYDEKTLWAWGSENAALLRPTVKISADLNFHKTMHLLKQYIYEKLFYHDTNVILKKGIVNATLYDS